MDIALQWNPGLGDADLVLAAGDLATDAGLITSAIISLFSDRLAESGDTIPNSGTDRRGWWGDLPLAAADESSAAPDRIGSRLWLLGRALQTQQTLTAAERYAEEGLAWMLADGVASSVVAKATFPRPGWIELDVTITQASGNTTFSVQWQNT